MSTFTRAVDPGDDYDPTYLYDDSLRYEAQYAAGAATTMMGLDSAMMSTYGQQYPFSIDGFGIYEAEPVGAPEFFTDPYGIEAFDLPDLSLHVTTLDGFGAPAKIKDPCKGKVGKAKKKCEEEQKAVAGATSTIEIPKPSWVSRNKWWVIGGAAAAVVIGGGAWWLLRRRRGV